MLPREKLLHLGAHTLSDTELLALFLRTGVAGKNVFQLADELIQQFRGLAGLIQSSAQDLVGVKGLGGTAKRAQLIGILEMSRRVLTQQLQEQPIMNSPKIVKDFLQLQIGALAHEVFAVMFLDNQNRLLSFQPMFRGSLTQTMVYPREIAKVALALNANGVVLSHNHPSGVLEPSQNDLDLTRSLRMTLSMIDVRIHDHIIVTRTGAFSMAEAGLV